MFYQHFLFFKQTVKSQCLSNTSVKRSLFFSQKRLAKNDFGYLKRISKPLEMNSDLMYTKWESEYDKLEEELERFRTYFNNVKKCNCDIAKCHHYKKARHKIFGNRIDQLYNLSLQIGFQTYEETINSDKSKLETLSQ